MSCGGNRLAPLFVVNALYCLIAGWSSLVARQVHTLEVGWFESPSRDHAPLRLSALMARQHVGPYHVSGRWALLPPTGSALGG